ncbi:MAG TPA: substrate-binding domain-containing protein [Burkholderiales bacterium]
MIARCIALLALWTALTPVWGQAALKVYAAGSLKAAFQELAAEYQRGAGVEVPADLAVGADYGVTVLTGGLRRGADFVAFLLSPAGQQVLARHGFAPAQ